MSYCRFSSMNWMCDVYVYEDVSGGWTTHVAGNRKIFPPIPDIIGGKLSTFFHGWSGVHWDKESKSLVYPNTRRAIIYRAWSRFVSFWHSKIHLGLMRLIPSRSIGLKYDGETFNHATSEECAEWLIELKTMGYKVPQYAIDSLNSED